MNNDKIPVLTDIIEGDGEEQIDITQPELGLDLKHDMIIDDGDEPEFLIDQESLRPTSSTAGKGLPDNPQLEQTIRRILDEHLELAWQEIRLAIQLAKDEDGSKD